MKAVFYVKKEKPYLRDKHNVYGEYHCFPQQVIAAHYLNGKIIAECDYEIEDIVYKHIHERDRFGILHNEAWYEYKGLNVSHYECVLSLRSGFNNSSSLFDYLFDYLDSENGKAINIKNLHIFDEPREMDEGFSQVNNCCFEKEFDTVKMWQERQ